MSALLGIVVIFVWCAFIFWACVAVAGVWFGGGICGLALFVYGLTLGASLSGDER